MKHKGKRKYSNNAIQYFSDLGPWVAETFEAFKTTDVDETEFGPNHCQIIQDGNTTDTENSVVKVITDSEMLVTAIFTSSSLHNFYQRYGDATWQNKMLMLEKFKITHLTHISEFGELAVIVEKFCCIGEPKYTPEKFPFQLYWAGTIPVIRQKCKEIWENKLLDGIDGTLELSDNKLQNKLSFMPTSSSDFLSGTHSARGVLIVSFEEREMLNSLPGWNRNYKRAVLGKHSLIKRSENNYVNSSEQLLNEHSSKKQEIKENHSKTSVTNIDNVKDSNQCIGREAGIGVNVASCYNEVNRTASERKMKDPVMTSIKNKVGISCITNTACTSVVLSDNKGDCIHSLIKQQNFEKEEQRLLNLQQGQLFSPVYTDASFITTSKENLFTQCDFSASSSIKRNCPTEYFYEKKCTKPNEDPSNKNIYNHCVSICNFKSDSLVDISQNEFLNNFCSDNNESTKAEQFCTQYCTPLWSERGKENLITNKQHFFKCGNNLQKSSRKVKYSQLLRFFPRNIPDNSALDSSPNKKYTQQLISIMDPLSSNIIDNSLVNGRHFTSVKSRKRLKISPAFEKANLFEFVFNKCNYIGQRENEITITKNQKTGINGIQTWDIFRVYFPDFKRTCGYYNDLPSMPVSVVSPNKLQIAADLEKPKSATSFQDNKNISSSKSEFLSSEPKFEWTFSELHINSMWTKLVELLLEQKS